MSVSIEEARTKLFSDIAVIISFATFVVFLVILIKDNNKTWALIWMIIMI